jgi:carboxypeptidase C (cathepsin A)
VDQLQWEGSEGWKATDTVEWSVGSDGEAAGTYTAYGGLSFVKVFDAGHMVRSSHASCGLRLSVVLSLPQSRGDEGV